MTTGIPQPTKEYAVGLMLVCTWRLHLARLNNHRQKIDFINSRDCWLESRVSNSAYMVGPAKSYLAFPYDMGIEFIQYPS